MRIVQKYGGTSLQSDERLRAAACRAAEAARAGHQVVVVVSARGDLTDRLLSQVRRIAPEPPARELDACLAVGEQFSAGLMAMALKGMGCDAVSLTGAQAGIRTDDRFGAAGIVRIDTARILRELEAGRIVVAAGFQGISPDGDITTLGRGGSDTTAAALAAALRADRCLIYTDVDGVYDRDPRLYPDAVRYDRIGYEAMLALIGRGAQVLHRPSVEIARASGITLEVLSAFTGRPGTLVGGE